MPRVPFDDLPDQGRVWVFPASRALTADEAERCLREVDDFLETWRAHGVPLRSGRELVERRFLLVGVDVDAEAPSGCSIDALVNRLRALGASLGVTLVDHAPVWFRTNGEIRAVPRAEFRRLVAAGAVGPQVRVIDTTLTRVWQVRSGALERPAAESWHARAFFASHGRG
jgi:hypothetical protein